jgi:hypothetical protein
MGTQQLDFLEHFQTVFVRERNVEDEQIPGFAADGR